MPGAPRLRPKARHDGLLLSLGALIARRAGRTGSVRRRQPPDEPRIVPLASKLTQKWRALPFYLQF
jgi:hypothetical protein